MSFEDVQTIRKIGAIILDRDGRLLVVKKNVPGRNTYIIPGGRQEKGETYLQTLKRELREELGVNVRTAEYFGEYEEKAEFEDAQIKVTVYKVTIQGNPTPNSEIVDLLWIERRYSEKGVQIGSILARHIIPVIFPT